MRSWPRFSNFSWTNRVDSTIYGRSSHSNELCKTLCQSWTVDCWQNQPTQQFSTSGGRHYVPGCLSSEHAHPCISPVLIQWDDDGTRRYTSQMYPGSPVSRTKKLIYWSIIPALKCILPVYAHCTQLHHSTDPTMTLERILLVHVRSYVTTDWLNASSTLSLPSSDQCSKAGVLLYGVRLWVRPLWSSL